LCACAAPFLPADFILRHRLLNLPDQRPGLVEANDPAGGTGLGLSIAKWIAERHHASFGGGERGGPGVGFSDPVPGYLASSITTGPPIEPMSNVASIL